MSGNFVRELQRIYMYIIYVNNTLPLAHEISRHFWAAYVTILKFTLFATNSCKPVEITKNNPPIFAENVLRHHLTAGNTQNYRVKNNFKALLQSTFSCVRLRALTIGSPLKAVV